MTVSSLQQGKELHKIVRSVLLNVIYHSALVNYSRRCLSMTYWSELGRRCPRSSFAYSSKAMNDVAFIQFRTSRVKEFCDLFMQVI